MGASTTYPTWTFRFPSPAKCRLTDFFWLSWLRASTSSARRNSLSITGLLNRSDWMSVNLTDRIPSAHHMLRISASTVVVPEGFSARRTPAGAVLLEAR